MEAISEEELATTVKLMEDMERFERECGRGGKAQRKEREVEYKTYLKPPANKFSVKRQGSCSSEASEDASSFLSPSISSCS